MINCNKRDVVILGANSSAGASVTGCANSPDVLRRLGLLEELSSISSTIDAGNVLDCASEDFWYINKIKSLYEVVECGGKIRKAISKYFRNNTLLLTIGGDHSISMGTIAEILKYDDNVGIIYFDAHTDINTELTSPTQNAHGMVLSALCGMCTSNLNKIRGNNILKQDNIFWIGTRSIDEDEKNNIKHPTNIYSCARIQQIGFASTLDEILGKILEKGLKHIHVSFDIDVMDPNIIPATGVRVQGGLAIEDCMVFIEWLSNLPQICSIDFVEYNPLLDDKDFSSGKWCVNTIKNLIKYSI